MPYGEISFNPRPREGSDVVMVSGEDHLDTFQSAPPRRERFKEGLDLSASDKVSIRAPAKGAMHRSADPPRGRGRFNPRPREGSDVTLRNKEVLLCRFNPRPREGSDPAADGP